MAKALTRLKVQQQLSKFNNVSNVQHPVHDDINFDYNSLHLNVGMTGSGKTFNVFNEIIALNEVPHKFHLFVYVTNNPNDETFMKLKDLIQIPVVMVSYENSEEYISELREYKQAYDEIVNKNLVDKITDECKEDILGNLQVDSFGRDIYTIILYDDAMNIFKRPSSKEYKYLFEYRHFKTTYFLVIQAWKGITPELKAQLGGIWLFGKFNRQQFNYLFQQLSVSIDKEDLYNIYKQLTKREYLYFHITSDDSSIYYVNENGEKRNLEDYEDEENADKYTCTEPVVQW